MFCPTCGADVPATKHCQNCGSLLVADARGAADVSDASEAEPVQPARQAAPVPADEPGLGGSSPDGGLADSSPESPLEDADYSAGADSRKPRPSVYEWNDVPENGDVARFSNKAPYTAFVLVIVGLVLGLAGFAVYPIIPALACCIIGLALNRGYRQKGKDNPRNGATVAIGVIGIVVAVIMAVVFVFMGNATPAASGGNGTGGSQASATANAPGATNASASGESTSGAQVSGGSSAQSSGSGSSVAAGTPSASVSAPDPRSFDAQGNPTLYAVCELTGSRLQDELGAAGFVWVEGASTWMSTTNALLEVQGENGLMKRDEIARLDKGASKSAVAFVIMAEGYAAPDEALRALTENVTVGDTYVGSDADVVFALVSSSGGAEYLTAVTKTDDSQQTILVFTEKAVEGGLFSAITGVDSVKSIGDVWKALKANKA